MSVASRAESMEANTDSTHLDENTVLDLVESGLEVRREGKLRVQPLSGFLSLVGRLYNGR